jgi:hypothetical protein
LELGFCAITLGFEFARPRTGACERSRPRSENNKAENNKAENNKAKNSQAERQIILC